MKRVFETAILFGEQIISYPFFLFCAVKQLPMAKNQRKSKSKKKIKGKQSTARFSISEFWKERKDVVTFLLSFLVLVLILFALSATDVFNIIRQPLTNLYTWISGQTLNLFGSNVLIKGDVLSNSKFVINVKAGCDGVAPMILYWTTIAVFPMKWKYKWKGLLYGTIFLFILNIIRIISLFLAGVYVRSIFDFLHVEVWQIIFIAMTIFVWLYWYKWAQQMSAKPLA